MFTFPYFKNVVSTTQKIEKPAWSRPSLADDVSSRVNRHNTDPNVHLSNPRLMRNALHERFVSFAHGDGPPDLDSIASQGPLRGFVPQSSTPISLSVPYFVKLNDCLKQSAIQVTSGLDLPDCALELVQDFCFKARRYPLDPVTKWLQRNLIFDLHCYFYSQYCTGEPAVMDEDFDPADAWDRGYLVDDFPVYTGEFDENYHPILDFTAYTLSPRLTAELPSGIFLPNGTNQIVLQYWYEPHPSLLDNFNELIVVTSGVADREDNARLRELARRRELIQRVRPYDPRRVISLAIGTCLNLLTLFLWFQPISYLTFIALFGVNFFVSSVLVVFSGRYGHPANHRFRNAAIERYVFWVSVVSYCFRTVRAKVDVYCHRIGRILAGLRRVYAAYDYARRARARVHAVLDNIVVQDTLLVQMLASNRGYYERKLLSWVDKILSFVLGVANSTNVTQYAMHFKNFIDSFQLPQEVYDWGFEMFRRLVTTLRPTNGVLDVIKERFSSSDFKFTDYPVLTDLIVLSVAITTLPMLGSEPSKFGTSIMHTIKSGLKNGPFIVIIAGTVLRTTQAVLRLTMGRSAPVSPDDVEQWFNRVISSKKKFKSLHYQVTRDEPDLDLSGTLQSRVGDLGAMITQGNELLTLKCLDSEISSILRAQFVSYLSDLKKEKLQIQLYLNGCSYRQEPAVVHFVGSAGCGKSFFTELIIQHYGKLFDIDCSTASRYPITGDSDHMDGFSYGKTFFIYDDNQPFDPKADGINPNVAQFQHVVNTMPAIAKMADLPDKGKYPISPSVVVVNGNKPCFGILGVCADKNAYLRRLAFAWEIVLRDEFRGDDGKPLPHTNDHFNEAYILRRYAPILKSNGITHGGLWAHYQPVMSPSGHADWTVMEFFGAVNDYFLTHVEKQHSHIANLSRNYALCPEHNTLSIICKCDLPDNTLSENDNGDFTDIDFSLLTKKETNKVMNEQLTNIISDYSKDVYTKVVPYAIPVAATVVGSALFATYASRRFEESTGTNLNVVETGVYNTVVPAVPQSCVSITKSLLLTLVRNNLVTLYTTDSLDSPTYATNTAIHLDRGVYMAPLHSFSCGKTLGVLEHKTTQGQSRPHFVRMFPVAMENDLCLFRYLEIPPKGKGLLKFLYDKDIDENLKHTLLSNNNHDQNTVTVDARKTTVSYPSNDGSTIHLNKCVEISVPTKTGVSGSPLIVDLSGRGYGIGGLSVSSDLTSVSFVARFDVAKIKEEIEKLTLRVGNIIPTSDLSNVKWESFSPPTTPINLRRATPEYVAGFGERQFYAGKKFTWSGDDSKVRKTSICKKLSFLNSDQLEIPNFKTKVINGVHQNDTSCINNQVRLLKSSKPNFSNSARIERVMSEITDRLISVFESCEVGSYREMTLLEAINGDGELEGMHLNTSAGFPYMGPKTNILDEVSPDVYDFKPAVKKDFESYMQASRDGINYQIPFVGIGKDEAVKPQKNIDGTLRYFYCGSALSLARSRVTYGWFVKNFKKCNLLLQSAWGLSSEDEWTQMMHIMLSGSPDREKFIAGDFPKFDTQLHAFISLLLRTVIKNVCKYFDDCNVLNSNLFDVSMTDESFPCVCLKGDTYVYSGNNPSGSFLTTLINILYNVFVHAYAFYGICPDGDYYRDVFGFYYGDDSLLKSVNDAFNQLSISEELAKEGMAYTDSMKNRNPDPYIGRYEVTFLGRRFSEYNNTFLSPLRGSAWVKQLCWLSPATKTEESDRMLSVWPTLMYEIAKVKIGDVVPDLDQQSVMDNIDQISFIASEVYGHEFPVPTDWDQAYIDGNKRYGDCMDYTPTYDNIVVTSGVVEANDPSSGAVDEQPIISFVDQFAPEPTPTPAVRLSPALDPRVGLHDIIHREVLIDHFTWLHGDAFSRVYYLTTTMFNNDVIAAALRNYTLAEWDSIEVRIMTNGNAFTQGLMCAGAIPLRSEWVVGQGVAFNEGRYGDRLNSILNDASAGANRADIMQVVQMPGPNFIDVGMSETVTFSVPFNGPVPRVNINTAKFYTIALGGDPRDNVSMLRISTYDVLRTSNLEVSDADVAIYARFVNFRASAPAIVTTSGLVQAQHGERQEAGTVTKVLNQVSSATKLLSDVPFIGGVAKGISSIANVGSKISHIFGWSKPLNLDPPTRVVRSVGESMAITDNLSSAFGLTVTDGAQIDCNPLQLGNGPVDPMDFGAIARQWSLIATSVVTANTPIGTAVFGFVVHPVHTFMSSSNLAVQPTHQAMVAYWHKHWSGDQDYMIAPIFAANERMRVSVSMSPNSANHDTGPSNQQYNKVFDLVQGSRIVFKVVWMQSDQFLLVRHTQTSAGGLVIDTSVIPYDPLYDNGTVEVNILNRMVAPVPTAQATILLFQRAGDYTEYAVPDGSVLNNVFPTSGSISSTNFDLPSRGEERIEVFGVPESTEFLELVPKMWFGERITSFRQLVKRYCFYGILSVKDSGTTTSASNYQKNMGWYPNPHLSASIKGEFILAGTIGSANSFMDSERWMNNTTLLAQLRGCYMGWNGSFNHMAIFDQDGAGGTIALSTYVLRGQEPFYQSSFPHVDRIDLTVRNQGSITETGHKPLNSRYSGTMSTNYTINSLNYNIPYYSHTLYSGGGTGLYFPSDSSNAQYNLNDGLERNGHAIGVTTNPFIYWDHFVAAGDDFNLLYYIGPPLWMADQVSLTI